MGMDIWHCLGYHHHSTHMFTIDHRKSIQNFKCSLKLSSWWSFVMITFNIWLSSRILLLWIWYSYFSARCLQVCFLVVLMLFASVVLLWGLFKAVCPSVSLYTHLFVRACVCACPETGGQVSTACSVCPLHCVLQVIYCFPMLLWLLYSCTITNPNQSVSSGWWWSQQADLNIFLDLFNLF